ncbi:MAG: glucosaminidase domain-containing protein [Endozoicomonadaceae bacterium]|nr:glucosaminidase domain-containing protein [Endozoicomonadaceae bacterium]
MKPIDFKRYTLFLVMTYLLLPALSCVYVPAHKPDFSSMPVTERKEAFTAMMLPLIRAANKKVMSQRQYVEKLSHQHTFSDDEITLLRRIGDQYKLPLSKTPPEKSWFEKILTRVDILPPSMMLVQAATESAWGTSRFSVTGNNYYGMWCYSKGCGMVPKERPAGHTYEVRRFNTTQDSVDAYLHNINTFSAYVGLRSIRADQRSEKKPLNSMELVEGLVKYSQMGAAYVESLRKWIRRDHLRKFDEQMVTEPEPAVKDIKNAKDVQDAKDTKDIHYYKQASRLFENHKP